MEPSQPSGGVQFKKSTTVNFDDEKTKIIEDKSVDKTRQEAAPLPVIEMETESKERTYSSKISEYRVFGSGNVDLLSCRIDPEDTMIAGGASDGTIKIYSLSSGTDEKPLHTMNGAEMPGIPITSLRWRPHSGANKIKHILLSSCADGTVSHWHVPSGKLLHRIVETDNQVLCMDYNKDGSNFATAGKDRKIRIYDEGTKSMVVELAAGFMQNPGHSNRIFSLKYHPDDVNVLISGAWDNTVYFWDVRDGKSYASIYGPAISGDALDIKGNTILTGSWRSKEQLELWDFASRKRISTVEWEAGSNVENAYIYSCQFSRANNDTILAGSSKLNEVRIFDRKNGNKNIAKITHFSKGVYSVDYAHTMDLFAFCGGEGRVHVVQIHK